jgi:alpha-amylase
LYDRALNRGELGRWLVSFIDNHDQIGQDFKRRFAAGADDRQVIAAVGYLICSVGTPCIYYGTEQGLSGEGPGDEFIREPLFDLQDTGRDFLNRECAIYRGIAAIARVQRERPALRFGRMYFREVSTNGRDFALPRSQPCVLAFSRLLADREVLVVYNTSTTSRLSASVLVDWDLNRPGDRLHFLFGGSGDVEVKDAPSGPRCVAVDLEPMQFAILGTPT